MVNMRKGHVAMKACVDRGRAGIEIEGAMIQRMHHRVFLVEALVETLQAFELVHVEGGEAVELHGADVTARALDPQHGDRLAGQRVFRRDLGGGVATAEIGDAQIRAQQVGPIEEEARLIHFGGLGVIPKGGNSGGIAHVVLAFNTKEGTRRGCPARSRV